MRNNLIFSIAFAVLSPIAYVILVRKKTRNVKCINTGCILLYTLLILYLTILRRPSGETGHYNFELFWSYQFWNRADYRWQIYMNVLLFVPFGFLFSDAYDHSLWKTVLTGFALSGIIEAIQYFFAIGLCELDDVFHNTLGALLG